MRNAKLLQLLGNCKGEYIYDLCVGTDFLKKKQHKTQTKRLIILTILKSRFQKTFKNIVKRVKSKPQTGRAYL